MDAELLQQCGRRTGAIYLWGYCIEMLLKAEVFATLGDESSFISIKDLQAASALSTDFGHALEGQLAQRCSLGNAADSPPNRLGENSRGESSVVQ